MAEKKQLMTHERDLGPGVVQTPGYPVEDAPALNGIADRRIDAHGVVADHPTLSTYDGPQNGMQPGPDTKVPKPRLEITEVKNADGSASTTSTPKDA
jgi:hypothetical protein